MTTADPAAVAFFHERLAFQTDVADVHAARLAGGFVLVDSRSGAAWAQGRVPGAVHLPTADIPGRADPAVPVVTYCWGPGCNGATRAALALARLGFGVREMIGGIEYRIREGLRSRRRPGASRSRPTPAPCGC